MAEFVELKIEETIREVEETERIGLLSSKEVKKLIVKRKEFEYRLARRAKRKEDFLSYIEYEKKLIELLRIRRKSVGTNEKRQQIEQSIGRRNIRRLRFLTRCWPQDLDTWQLRVDFAGYLGFKDEISFTYQEQTRFHPNRVGVWVAWAKFELEERNNFDTARVILLSKAALHHPKSLLLKRELFRMELLYVEKLNKKKTQDNIAGMEEIIEENRTKVLNCAVAEAVYREAASSIPEPELYKQLYVVASRFPFAHSLRENIYRDFCAKFPSAECLYKIKAVRAADGITDDKEISVGDLTLEEKKGDNDEKEDDDKEEGDDYEEEGDDDDEEEDDDTEEEDDNKEKEDDDKEKEDDKEEEDDDKKEVEEDTKHIPETVKLEPIEKLKNITTTFDSALTTIGEDFANSYVGEMLPLLHQCWGMEEMARHVLAKIRDVGQRFQKALSPLNYFVLSRVLKEVGAGHSEQTRVLQAATEVHPAESHLLLEWLRQLAAHPSTRTQMLQVFQDISSDVVGECGLAVWEEVIAASPATQKEEVLSRGANHASKTVSQGVRTRYIQWLHENKTKLETRQAYKKLCWMPPFSAGIHAKMLGIEVARDSVDVRFVQEIFSNALLQNGNKCPGVWLAYIYFEKKFGDAALVGGLVTRAEDELDAKEAQTFRELLTEMREQQGETSDQTSDTIIVDGEDVALEEEVVEDEALVRLFEEDLLMSHEAYRGRTSFFKDVTAMKKRLLRGNKETTRDSEVWEEVVQCLTGRPCRLAVRIVRPEEPTDEPANKSKNRYNLSDELQVGESLSGRGGSDVSDILATSKTLQPEFHKQKSVDPFVVNRKNRTKNNKAEREKTKGPGWFGMEAPKMTEELQRDLEVLKMRSVLEPGRKYKRNDMEKLPKYFQMGRVVDSAVDFYSSRVPKKQRKRTLAEEIINDEEALRYQKRKYTEIIQEKEKHTKNKGKGKGKKKRA